MSDKTTVERAIELARGGSCRSVTEIAWQLRRESFSNVDGHLSGATIKRQLREALSQR